MNQGVRTPEVLAEVIDGATNLRQLDLVLASQREDVRFGKVAEREPGVRRICEFDDRSDRRLAPRGRVPEQQRDAGVELPRMLLLDPP